MQLTLRAQCRKTADIRTGKTACKGAGGEACPFLCEMGCANRTRIRKYF